MSEPENNPGKDEIGEGAVRNYVDAERPGSEFDTREMPALPDGTEETKADESIHGVVVDASRPGSNHDTYVGSRDEFESVERVAALPGRGGSNDQTRAFEKADDDDDEDATAMATRKADAFDDLETREVPILSDDWKRRATEVAEAMGETAEVIGPFGDEEAADASLAASVAAASGELPALLDQSNQVAGSVLEKARAAQLEWAALRFEQRLSFFDRLRSELVLQRGDYVPSMATAIGRPMVETLSGEYLPVLEALRTLDEVVPPLLVDQHAAGSPVTHQGLSAAVRMTPWGVVLLANGARSPFAFPMTLAIDALATGNAVVLCGAEVHPRVNETMRKLFRRAEFPEGLVQVVGGDSETIRVLVEMGADKVIFEGDAELAARLARRCVASGADLQVIRKAKEMLVVLASANIERAITAALSGAFASGGLRQGAIERIVVEASIYDEFRMRFIDAIRTMNSHHAQLATIHDSFNPRRAQLLVEDAIAGGARVTYPAGENPGRWIHWKAAVVEALPPSAKLSTENFEGPGCVLYRAVSVADEAHTLLRLLPANNITVLGRPDRALTARLEALPAARVAFNEPLLAGAALSGGVPVGPETPRTICGPHSMLRPKLVVHSEDAGRRIGWFPYTDDKAYAMMDAIEAMYGTQAGKRLKASFKLLLNPSVRRLLQGEE